MDRRLRGEAITAPTTERQATPFEDIDAKTISKYRSPKASSGMGDFPVRFRIAHVPQ
jgi:hypothetical protein